MRACLLAVELTRRAGLSVGSQGDAYYGALEHVRSDDPELARKQDRMNWLNRVVVLCDCNRPTLQSIEGAGFTVTKLEWSILPKAPKFASR